MNHLPFHTAHHWITRLAQLPHPITINHIPPLAMDFSWEPANHINGYIYKENSTTTLIQILSSKKTGRVFSITFSLAKSRPPTLSGSLNLVEFYPSCLNEAKNSWGPPADFTTNPTSSIWKLHNHAYIQLSLHPNQIMASFDLIDPNGPE